MADLFDIVTARKLSGGGGGSSDFSTASVTFINADTTTTYTAKIFHITNDAYISEELMDVSDPVTVDVPLYKGRAEVELLMALTKVDGSYMPTATGGVFLRPFSKLVITGDGTITAKGLQGGLEL